MNESSYTETSSGEEEGVVEETQLNELKQDLESIKNNVTRSFGNADYYSNHVRNCRWPGQSPDGRKREDAMGKKPFPFDGASDSRIFHCDEIINERVMFQMAAILRAKPKVSGMESTDANLGGKINTLLNWMLFNQIGRSFLREVEKALNWKEGDCPGMSVLGVYWDNRESLRPQTVTIEGVIDYLTGLMEQGAPPEEMSSILDAIMDETREEEAAMFIQALLPTLRFERSVQAVKELREDGTTRIPTPYQSKNMLKICAHRLNHDIFIPDGTEDIQSARVIMVREILTEAETKARRVEMGWSEEFLEQAIGNEEESIDGVKGHRVVNSYDYTTYNEDGTLNEEEKNTYEFWTAYFRAVNDDYESGIYYVTFHPEIDVAATDRMLLDYSHDKYPFVDLCRENKTPDLAGSRGVTEISQSEQDILKMLNDGTCDNAQLGMLPPIMKHSRWRGVRLTISPLVEITRNRKDDYEWFDPPPLPKMAIEQQNITQMRSDRYWGRTSENVPPDLQMLHRNFMISKVLGSMADVYSMGLQLALQYLDDDQIQRVVGGDGVPIARSVQEIQGMYDITLSFDARTMDPQYVTGLIDSLAKVLQFDTESTVLRDKLVSHILNLLSAEMADQVTIPVTSANQKEIENEMVNFALIGAGVEPPLLESGHNAQLRLSVLSDIVNKNPEALQNMSEKSREILETRVQNLEFQVEQRENAVIGRTGTAPALQE